MYQNNLKIIERLSQNIIMKILLILFFIAGLLLLGGGIKNYFYLPKAAEKYNVVYAFYNHNNNKVSYELNGEEKVVTNIKDYVSENKMKISFRENMSIRLYCNKTKYSECIYINEFDKPSTLIIVGLIFLTIVLWFWLSASYSKRTDDGQKPQKFSPSYPFGLLIAILGVYVIISPFIQKYNDNKIIKQGNLVKGTIYSELYFSTIDTQESEDRYIPIAYYYVGEKKYMYINPKEIDGYLDEVINNQIDIYYDKNDPSKAVQDNNTFDIISPLFGIFVILTGLVLSVFSKPLEKLALKKAIDNPAPEWKI